jgi:hypothetical protein
MGGSRDPDRTARDGASVVLPGSAARQAWQASCRAAILVFAMESEVGVSTLPPCHRCRVTLTAIAPRLCAGLTVQLGLWSR